MKSNAEIRKEAWAIVRGKWFWRIVAAGSALYFIAIAVALAILASYSDMEIQTWSDFLESKVRAFQSGLGYTVPSRAAFWQMTGASAFQQFMAYVFGAIVLFGMAGVLLKAARDDEKEWFAGAFGGFRRPLEVTWLLALMNLLVFLWGLLFVIPGVVAVYRYRQAWYLKSENPDWSAGKCLSKSGKMMKGMKWRAFCLDLSFVGWLLLTWSVVAVATVGMAVSTKGGGAVAALTGVLAGSFGFFFLAFFLAYFSAARAVFYRELSCARACDLV